MLSGIDCPLESFIGAFQDSLTVLLESIINILP